MTVQVHRATGQLVAGGSATIVMTKVGQARSMRVSDFKPGDEVVLQSWRHTPIGTLHWDDNVHAPMIGMRVKLEGKISSNVMGSTLWGFSPGRAGVCAWLGEALTLADASAPPTERNGSPKPVEEEEKPQWLIAREACIDPATECVKCGAPRSATKPCKYHEPEPAPSPTNGWGFLGGS